MEKIFLRSGACAVIRDSGAGIEIEYLGNFNQFPDVQPRKRTEYPALCPGWMPKAKVKK